MRDCWKSKEDLMEAFKKTLEGFRVQCNCGSDEVYLTNDMGFSGTSGGWGSVDLVCNKCGAQVTLAELG